MRIRGVELHVEDVGEGPPILFSHGLLFSARMYAAQVEALRGRYRCVSYDHCGQGRSGDRGEHAVSIESLYEDAVALIEALDLAPCHFVGLSMGGFLGLRLAARRPELVRSLVLIATGAHPESLRKIVKYRAMLAAVRMGLAPYLAPVLARVMFGGDFRTDPAHADALERELGRFRALDEHIFPAVRGVLQRDAVTEACAKIDTPTLVLHGEDDGAIDVAEARRTTRAIRGAKLTVLPGVGHSATLEDPPTVNEALAAFLDAH